jgi:hypothetical protein
MSYILLYVVLYLVIHLIFDLLKPALQARQLFFRRTAREKYPVPPPPHRGQEESANASERTAYKHFKTLCIIGIVLILIPFFFVAAWINKYRDRRIARNPDTTPEKLQELANSHDRLTRHALVKNLNTPPEALLYLVQDFPFEVVEHPMFSLMLLENPRLIEEMNHNVLVSLFKHQKIPDIFFLGAATHYHPIVLETIVKHQSVTFPILERIAARTSDSQVCQMIVNHPLITLPYLQQWATQGSVSMQVAIAQVYSDQSLPHAEEILLLLIEHGSEEVWRVISHCSSLSDMLINRLLLKIPPVLLNDLAESSYTHGAVLQKLAITCHNFLSDTTHLKARIARNPSTPIDIIDQWIVDPSYKIRAAVAQRQDLSLNHCLQLALDDFKQVRRNLRRNQSITSVILKQLAKSSHLRVRQFVASHPNTHPYLRALLFQQMEDDRSSPPS